MKHLWLTSIFILVLAIKVIVLLFDASPMLFMGDSGTYLDTAIFGTHPSDRSYFYGLFVRIASLFNYSLSILVVIQVLLSTMTAIVLGIILRYQLAVSRLLATIAVIAFAVEPLQLMYERYVMTETLTLFLFSVFLYLCIAGTLDCKIKPLLGAAFLSYFIIELRTAYLPTVVLTLILITLYLLIKKRNKPGHRLIYPISLLLLILASPDLVSALTGEPKKTENGYFLAAIVAPLIVSDDFPNPSAGQEILDQVSCPLDNPRSREAQRWLPHCLIGKMKDHYGQQQANSIASSVAVNAIKRDPVGFFELGMVNYLDFFNVEAIKNSINYESGYNRQPIREELLEQVNTHFDFDAKGIQQKKTVTKTYTAGSVLWLQVLALSPLLFIPFLFLWRRTIPFPVLLIWICQLSFVAVSVFLATKCVIRYLHPSAFIFFIQLSLIISCFFYSKKHNKT